ncbi:hypothetical protein NDR87_31080 [Nocardia sp. CDC159]|uniref:Uncharacterized protein n=1 Tax=Nocardia pulmonis TaxID=2951408 RepID=A0A9X2EEJ7_9NOCA|nr:MULTISPECIES: hypothetical protein [Nocardia]MCM6778005.1 hypothetical protein [Nocardia pulmonis]MCM6790824.1 hypothetical protein [Nocardia sp. CDC159]
MIAPLHQRDIWAERHRFCDDTPPPIASLDEARYVLTIHAGHDGHCRQYAAAMARATGSAE